MNVGGHHFTKRQKYKSGIFLLVIAVAVLGAMCQKSLTAPTPFTLNVWRPSDTSSAFDDIVAAYKAEYPYITVEVRVFKKEEYENALIKAWARGEGPDVFAVPNARLGKFREFISPMPEKTTLTTYHDETKLGKTKRVVTKSDVSFPTINQLRDRFVPVVADDVVWNDQVYGLPLSMDTLVLYYNRDLLQRSQIAVPPTNWQEFLDDVERMTVIDADKKIILSSASLGTATNIPYFFDILSTLMIQNGTIMITQSGQISFANVVNDAQGEHVPGLDSFDFYMKFSDPAFQSYTWNNEQPNALEAFTQQNLGFYFGYYHDLSEIESRAPSLNFSYTNIPQINIGNPVNHANYLLESVAISSKHPEHAWNFINFETSQKNVQSFLEKTNNIPALNALIANVQDDPVKGVFAQQALNAHNWYHGHDPDEAIRIFSDMITTVLDRSTIAKDALELAAKKIRLTYEE